MKKGLIGIQMSTIKKKIEELGAYETLKACAELGYHCVEISQVAMTPENVAGMKKACDEFGIKVAACSASLEPTMPGMPGEFLVSDFDKIVADCKALNCDMLRIGMLPMNCMGNREKALDFVRRADEMAGRLKEHGIDLYYHNHHIEFVKYDGEYLLDIIKNNTKYMGFELDIHWIHRGGENPVEFIKSAMTPAKNVIVSIPDPEKREALVIVSEEEKKLAIGKSGSNIKLASKLTKYLLELTTMEEINKKGNSNE